MVTSGYVPTPPAPRAASVVEDDGVSDRRWHAGPVGDWRERGVRLARPSDRDAVIATAYAAFRADPGWAHLFGDDYDRLVGPFVTVLFDQRVAMGSAWVSEDVSAIALWDPPGTAEPAHDDPGWLAYEQTAGPVAWDRLNDYDTAVHAVKDTGPFWYLGILATHPAHQGQGLASAVMAPVLQQADADRLPCCLETSTPQNRAFYQRRGFTQAVQVDLPGAPTTWWLTRPAVASG
jgi:GNAT superfamily N-acetyltransferase